MPILKILLTGLAIYLVLVALVWMFQERIAFPAPRRTLPDPGEVGIRSGERVSVAASDGVVLHGWYLHPDPLPDDEERSAPGLIWFYGNYETVGVMAPVIRELRPRGWGMLILDIRGYGESGGQASEKGFYLDSEAAWDFLSSRPEIDASRIVVFGRSLGSSLALHLAVEKPIAGVILEAPFTSGRELGRSFYWWMPSFAIRIRMDNLSKAARTAAPVLVLHGSDDDIVPPEMGRRISEAAGNGSFEQFEAAGHNEILLGDADRYKTLWSEFLDSLGP